MSDEKTLKLSKKTLEKVMNTRLLKIFEEEGYTNVRYIDGVGWCGAYRFMFTVGICYGMTEISYSGRYCFNNSLDALLFLEGWDGITQPVIGEDGCTAIK